jgi:drug/metabolite transporter superfamily protein YnfA
MLLARQRIWNLSVLVCIHLLRDFLFLLQRQSTGSMGDIKVFAALGGIFVPSSNIGTRRYILLM